MKSLSKSTWIMLVYDIIIFCLAGYYLCKSFNLDRITEIIGVALIILTGIGALYLKENYKIREFNVTSWNIYRLFEGVIFANIPVAVFLYFTAPRALISKFLCINILFIYIFLLLYRLCFHLYLFKIKRTKNILILGADERARIIADEIQGKYALKMNVAGFVKTDKSENLISDKNLPVYNQSDNIEEIIINNNIDIVVISQATEFILKVPYGVSIYKMPDFYEMVTGKYYIDEKTITELYYQFATHRSVVYDFCKRAYDIIAALIILIVTLPVTAYIAIRVKLTDGASPFFSQTRVGKDGKTFECYKLRTMYVNDYVPKNAEMLNDGSDRVIPFCKFIRKAKLDEIPQMVNILRGEMSIVGPRAEWEKFAEVFKKDLPYYNCRMWVKTGWTGWAHISMPAAYSLDEEKERLGYDLYYIKHRNVLWEIGILVKAVFLATGGRHK